MKTMQINNDKGFTLIELILCIAILGILAVSVAPSFATLLADSSRTGGRGTVGAIQSAIQTSVAEDIAAGNAGSWPATLDSAPDGSTCSATTPCFDGVAQGVTSTLWSKVTATTYSYASGDITQTYTYDPATGILACSAGDC